MGEHIPTIPKSRNEHYLGAIIGQDTAQIPPQPQSRIEAYLLYILNNGTAREAEIREIIEALKGGMTYKGEVATVDNLPEPAESNKGWVYTVASNEHEYLSTGERWKDIDIEVSGKENLFRFTTMPTASADNLGQIVQYIGTSTADYVKGYFYQCVEVEGVYSWGQVNIQPGYDDSALTSRVSAIESQEDTWNSKQDAISDLEDIRSGAAAGETALQPSALTPYRTASAQDVIDEGLQDGIDVIEELIPSQATPSNKLADKEFVNSSIATNTATFRGTYTSTDDFPTSGVDDNDYVYLKVMSTVDPTQVERYDKYKWSESAFAFEYSLNNSSFTAAQWAAINSGMTSGDAALIRTALQPVPGKDLSTNDYTDADKQKLAGVEAGAEKNIAYATEPYDGVDLTQKFADEIANFADEWAWIKDRKTRGDFHGLHTHDFIPITCTNSGAYVLKMEIAGINTYKGAGATEIGNHIDFISKDCWPDAIQYNPVNYNNGICLDKFTADGETTEFQLTHRTANKFPSGLASVKVNGTEVAAGTYSYAAATGILTFNDAPANGAVIKAVWADADKIKAPFLASKLRAFIMSDKSGVPNEAAADPFLTEVDYTEGGIWKYLPDKVKNVIIDKWAYPGTRLVEGTLRTSENTWDSANLGKLWLPCEMEVYGEHIFSTAYESAFGRQYPCFMNGNRKKGAGNGGSRSYWWLSSPYSGGSTYFCVVDNGGYANSYGASDSLRVPVCFRI